MILFCHEQNLKLRYLEMKKIIIVTLILLANQIAAQNKWSLGGSASLDYSYRHNQFGDHKNIMNGQTLDGLENAGIGFTLGLKFKYKITNNIALISGLAFWQNNYGTSKINLKEIYPNDPSEPDRYSWSCRKEQLQLPVLFSFYYGQKLKLGVSAGLAINFSTLQTRTDYDEYNNGNSITSTRNELDNKRVYDLLFTSGIIGVGAAYNYKRLEFMLEPTINCKIFDISPGTDLYIWNAGLNLSVFYKL